jgi:hypothetical protein
MKTSTRTIVLALIASLTFLSVSSVEAAPPKALLLNPPQYQPSYLPKFGFRSYTLAGVGEVVTNVQWNSLAWKLGLQEGDIIRSVNYFELTYHGAWNDALRSALINNGGYVQLQIIDRNTGLIASRGVQFGGYGSPYVVGYGGDNGYCPEEHFGYPSGPVTYKSMAGPHNNTSKKSSTKGQVSLNDIAKMFKD